MPPNQANTGEEIEPLGKTAGAPNELLPESRSLIELYLSIRTGQQSKRNVKPGYALKVVEMAQEVERRHVSQFDEMCKRLTITHSGAYATFRSVCEELFRTGINWGRVSAYFAFGGALAESCVAKHMPNAVGQVTDWMTSYFEESLLEWIEDKGGWEEFEQHFSVKTQPAEVTGCLTTSGLKKLIRLEDVVVVGPNVAELFSLLPRKADDVEELMAPTRHPLP